MCKLTILVNLCLVLFAVGQTACAADAAAGARHALNEVVRQNILGGTQQSRLAGFDAVACDGVELEVFVVLLLERFHNRVGQTTAARKDAAVVGSVVEHVLWLAGSPSLNSIFFAVHGPMKTTFAPGVVSLM